MSVKRTILRPLRAINETIRWSFRRLPVGFTVPLLIITFVYFILLYPVLVYNVVPFLLALPARWAHSLFQFGAVSKMGSLGLWVAKLYHHLLHIAAALLTLVAAFAGIILGYGLASFSYHKWRRLRRKIKRPPVVASRLIARNASPSEVGPSQSPNPLERFQRIGIILAGGGAKGAYQAGAMKAIYEFLQQHNAHHKVKMIAGTSIGSWNALFWLADLVNDAGVDERGRRIPGALESWWRGINVSEIIKPVTYLPTRQNFFLSNEPWQENFDALFGKDTDAGRRLIEHMTNPDEDEAINFYFTCTNIQQARLEVTTNDNLKVKHRDPFLGGSDKLKNMAAKIARTLEELRFGVFSSMDLPPLFEYAAGQNGESSDFYEDGGVIDNLPIYFGTEVEECELLFVLPLNASFEQEVNRRSLIKRLARVTNIRQGVLERKAFRDIYLFNEIAYLRELAHQQQDLLRRSVVHLQGKKDTPPEVDDLTTDIQRVLVELPPSNTPAKDLSPLQRALRRKHKPVQVFAICPAPKLKINTAQFWKTEEAGEAFDLMYEATKRGLEHGFERIISGNFVTMWKIPDRGDPEPFTDF